MVRSMLQSGVAEQIRKYSHTDQLSSHAVTLSILNLANPYYGKNIVRKEGHNSLYYFKSVLTTGSTIILAVDTLTLPRPDFLRLDIACLSGHARNKISRISATYEQNFCPPPASMLTNKYRYYGIHMEMFLL